VTGLLAARAAAEYLAVSATTLRRLVHAREISVIRIGRAVRFAPADLDAFVERARSGPEAAGESAAPFVLRVQRPRAAGTGRLTPTDKPTDFWRTPTRSRDQVRTSQGRGGKETGVTGGAAG
jgi:excisionase family DNA binding protein